MISAALYLALVATVVEIRVDGGDGCVKAQTIRDRLETLLPGADSIVDYQAALFVGGDRKKMWLELHDPRGAVLGRRSLDASLSCPALTEEAAVVLAAWVAEIPYVHSVEVPELSEVSSSGRSSAETHEGSGALLSVAPLVSIVTSGPVSGGAFMEASLRVREAGTRATVGAFAILPRTQGLGTGQYAWMRAAVEIGVLEPIVRGSALSLEARAAFILAMLTTRGHGFSDNRRTFDADPALSLGLRLTGPQLFGATSLWLEVRMLGWLRAQSVWVDGLASEPKLPRIEALSGIGISWGDPR
jgi:hypothetical protein